MTKQTKVSHYKAKLTVDMFRQLRKAIEIPPEGLFATTVGAASKMTSAKWHVLEPMDIVDTMAKLARVSE